MADSQRKSYNLFDDVIAEGYYNDNGELVPDRPTERQAYHSTTYIPITNQRTFTISGLWRDSSSAWANFAVYEWDSNKNWLRRSNRQTPPPDNIITFTVGNDTAYITLQIQNVHSNIMLVTGSSAKPYEAYGAWFHSLRELKTATDTLSLPQIVYADGTAATIGLKGNTVQNGTPTSSSPVDVNGTGDRTENLCSGILANVNIESNGSISGNQSAFDLGYAKIEQGVTYTCNGMVTAFYTSIPTVGAVSYDGQRYVSGTDSTTFTAPIDGYCAFRNAHGSNFMLNTGSTAKPYEPYGFQIPITDNQTTTPIYLGSTASTRQIYKYICTGDENWTNNFGASLFMVQGIFNDNPFIPQIDSISTHYTYKPIQSGLDAGLAHGQYALQRSGTQQQYGYNIALKNTDYTDTTAFKTYLQQQYANGTPVTVWYVLSTATTGTVNEPLMKIGTYSDSISGVSLPTTDGANSLSIGTTVQPSEVTATYTGWHDAYVKEKSENLFDGTLEQGSFNADGSPAESNKRVRTTFDSDIYTAGSYVVSASGVDDVSMYVYDTNKVCIPAEGSGGWQPLPYSFELTGDRYVRFTFRKSDDSNIVPTDISNVMLNTGSTAQPYEPYWK